MIELPKIELTSTSDYYYDAKAQQYFPRVSNILKGFNWDPKGILLKWQCKLITNYLKEQKTYNTKSLAGIKKLVEEELNKAGLYGTKAHKWIEDFLIDHKQDEPEEQIKNTILSFIKWYFEDHINELQLVASEYPIKSTKYLYAGTIDCIFFNKLKNELYIYDWKTSNRFQTKYYLQIAAYWQAFQEVTGLTIHSSKIIVFPKANSDKPLIKNMDRAMYEECFDMFIKCRDAYNFIYKYSEH